MNNQNNYERPEIALVGDVATLTLGFVNRQIVDGCDCTKNCGKAVGC